MKLALPPEKEILEPAPDGSLTVVPAGEGPDIETMKEAAPLAAWQPFETQIAEKKAAASALLQIVVTSENAATLAPSFKRLRLDIVPVRTGIDKKGKSLNAADEKRIKDRNEARFKLMLICEGLEAQLLERETFAAREEARIAEERRVERTALLAPLGQDCSFLSLASMPEEQFALLLAGAKQAQQAREAEKARVAEEARKAEEARIAREKAEAEAREAQRLENERLKKEAAEREAAAKLEREKADAEAKRLREEAAAKIEQERREAAEREAKLRAEVQEREKAAKAEADRLAAIAAAKARQERDALEAKFREEQSRQLAEQKRIQAEIDAARAARQAEIDAEIERKRKLAAAGDREKVATFVSDIRNVSLAEMSDRSLHAEIMDLKRRFLKAVEAKATHVPRSP